jgi:hypothetical protein
MNKTTIFKIKVDKDEFYKIAEYNLNNGWTYESIIKVLPDDLEVISQLDSFKYPITNIKELKNVIFNNIKDYDYESDLKYMLSYIDLIDIDDLLYLNDEVYNLAEKLGIVIVYPTNVHLNLINPIIYINDGNKEVKEIYKSEQPIIVNFQNKNYRIVLDDQNNIDTDLPGKIFKYFNISIEGNHYGLGIIYKKD